MIDDDAQTHKGMKNWRLRHGVRLSYWVLSAWAYAAVINIVSVPNVMALEHRETLLEYTHERRRSEDPVPTPYPQAFSVSFVTNMTISQTDGKPTGAPIAGVLYYDWTSRSQRVEHAAGSYECLHFYHTGGPCTMIFLPTGGMYRTIESSDDAGPTCCLDIPNLGAPPPDWAMNANPTFNGNVSDPFSGMGEVYQWTFDKLIPPIMRRSHISFSDKYHSTQEVIPGYESGGRPLLFTFPGGAKGKQDYHYDPSTMLIEPQDPALFQLPDGCAQLLCQSHNAAVLSN
eukprot:scaffold143861_cov60-Attheya_sp.AAC.4